MRSESEKNNSTAVFLLREQYDEIINDKVIEYMKAHIDGVISVDDICTELHYNRSYIYRQFKKTTGNSIMSYFVKMKINKAKYYLSKTSLNSTEIADLLFRGDTYKYRYKQK